MNIKERKGKQRPMEDMPEVVDGLYLGHRTTFHQRTGRDSNGPGGLG